MQTATTENDWLRKLVADMVSTDVHKTCTQSRHTFLLLQNIDWEGNDSFLGAMDMELNVLV